MQILASMFEAGQEMMRRMAGAQAAPNTDATSGDAANPFAAATRQFADMQQAWLNAAAATTNSQQPNPFEPFLASARQLAEMQQRMLEGMSAFRFDVMGETGAGATDDKRFAHEAWRSDPRYALLSKVYLAYAEFLQKGIDAVPVDERARAQMRFGMRQAIDAMSPSNFFLTNPEAAQLALETGGRSLTEGMALFMRDVARGRVSMTDEVAFEIGKNVATTPGAVIYENELMQVIQYTPSTTEVFARPLVIVPPCINKFYILDLQPENSFIRHAVEQGNTVFVVSWKNPHESESRATWDDYLELGPIAALDVARAITGEKQVNALGFCVGGTIIAAALAVMYARGDDPIASLTMLTALLDFEDSGVLDIFVDEAHVRMREQTLGAGGLMPGLELANTFSSLRANDLVWNYVVSNYLEGKAPPPFDLLYWNGDCTNLPGPMYSWYLRNTYLENNLRTPDRLVCCGERIDLNRIQVPAYVFAAKEDHIVPWKAAYASARLLPGDKPNAVRFVLGASGHIAGTINPPAKRKRSFWTTRGGSLPANSEAWLANAPADSHQGWPRAELETHLREEHSTFTWLFEPMLAQAGFTISEATYTPARTHASYTCVLKD